ncbi:MAG: hypothetical protein QM747_03725 [Nocardioides sp.]
MSLDSSYADLRARCRDLEQAVTELVTIVHEDRPHGSEIAVIDALGETVSELQAATVQANELLARVTEPRLVPAYLGAIDEAVATAEHIYWRQLRAFGPVSLLRRAERRDGREWPTWQRSVEASELRCELPLSEARAAVLRAWREAAELLGLYLPSPHTYREPEPASASVAGPTTRRPQ